MDALDKAVEYFKGQGALARAIGVFPQTVHNWMVRGRVPAEHCPAIERETAGQVTCEQLRPDVDWGYLRATRCEQQAA